MMGVYYRVRVESEGRIYFWCCDRSRNDPHGTLASPQCSACKSRCSSVVPPHSVESSRLCACRWKQQRSSLEGAFWSTRIASGRRQHPATPFHHRTLQCIVPYQYTVKSLSCPSSLNHSISTCVSGAAPQHPALTISALGRGVRAEHEAGQNRERRPELCSRHGGTAQEPREACLLPARAPHTKQHGCTG